MFKEARVNEVLKYVNTHSQATVEELARRFGVSAMTIRRDLTTLEKANMISRTHGGAVSSELLSYEEHYEQKQEKNAELKARIAHAALDLVQEDAVVFLDSGTTTYQLARLIKRERNHVTVFTNDLKIASELYETSHDVLIVGGRVQRETGSVIGSITNTFIENLNFDICFIGIQAVNHRLLLLTPLEDKAMNKQNYISKSITKVLICDSSKFNRNGLFTIVPMTAFNYVVTDFHFSADHRNQLASCNTEVIEVATEADSSQA